MEKYNDYMINQCYESDSKDKFPINWQEEVKAPVSGEKEEEKKTSTPN